MSRLPSWRMYGNYSGNYGVHALMFKVNGQEFYFSYETLVAFYHPQRGIVVRQNVWGPTTGKHLNAIDGGNKKHRVEGSEFERLFAEAYPEMDKDMAA